MVENAVSALEVAGVVMLSTLFSIGGGNGQVAVMQDVWVSTGLLAPALFAWAYALGNFSPGPKVSFIAAVGFYMAGLPGAIAAVIAIVIPTSIGASIASHWYLKFKSVVNHITLSATFVIAGMMTTAAISLGMPMSINIWGYVLIAVVAILFVWKGLDAVFIVLGTAAIGALTWWLG